MLRSIDTSSKTVEPLLLLDTRLGRYFGRDMWFQDGLYARVCSLDVAASQNLREERTEGIPTHL